MTSILKADNIQDADGNNIINESSNTITIGASGDTTNVIGTLQNDGVAVANTPAFKAFAASAQSLSSGTTTKVVFGTESYDTDSAYDHSTNHRFTVPSGKAGKYVFTSNFYAAVDNGTLEEQQFSIRKNGSDIASTAVDFRNNDDGSDNGMILTTTLDLSVGDYIEVFVTIVATNPAGRSGEANVYFTGHKLII